MQYAVTVDVLQTVFSVFGALEKDLKEQQVVQGAVENTLGAGSINLLLENPIPKANSLSNTPNPYEQGISIIGRTLSKFDEDDLIPCFGFGDASTHDQDVFVSLLTRNLAMDLKKLLDNAGNLINTLCTNVKQSGGQYHVLLIIADGKDAMAALPRSPNSARLPLSLRDARWIGESMAAWQGGLSQRFLKVVSYYGLTTLPYKLVCKLVGANLRRMLWNLT
uniref:Copine C-terminal domain-containing protein n=1 Tax=Zea mays TaxID=4577 RepID=A0A804MTS4_MAIZE